MEKATTIRNDYYISGISRKKVADKYNIHICTVSEILSNKIWKINQLEHEHYRKCLVLLKLEKKSITTHKICTKCKLDKNIFEFGFAAGEGSKRVAQCKACILAYKKQYAIDKADKIKAKKQAYYTINRDSIIDKTIVRQQGKKKEKAAYDKARLAKDPEKYRSERRAYYYDNKEDCIARISKRTAEQYAEDPVFKMRVRVSCEIGRALKKAGSSKNGHSCLEYLPYTMTNLKEHIENQFEPWMTWENWTKYDPKTWNDDDQATWTWQLDHIIPQSDLPYMNMMEENFQKCWALINLRPLSGKQNLLDGVYRIRHKNGK